MKRITEDARALALCGAIVGAVYTTAAPGEAGTAELVGMGFGGAIGGAALGWAIAALLRWRNR
jgi:hypothetical protein